MIEVSITHIDVTKAASCVAFEAWLIHRLRQAGVPVIGTFEYMGIESGGVDGVRPPRREHREAVPLEL